MKYCTNCGSKLREGAKFCPKCGTPTKIEIEKRNKEKKEKSVAAHEKLALNLGIVLIVLASILFIYLSWKNLSDLYKVLFISGEALLLCILSFISKKLKNKFMHKLCYFAFAILLPIIFLMANNYGLFITYFKSSAGLYVYLSILTACLVLIYYISYRIIKSHTYTFLSVISFVLFIIFSLKSCNISNSIILLTICSLSLIFNVLINKNILFKKNTNIANIMLNIVLIGLVPVIIIYLFDNEKFRLINLFITFIYIINLYLRWFLQKDTVLKYYIPFIAITILPIFFASTFDTNLVLFLSLIISILIYLIPIYMNDKATRIISFIIFIISLYIIFALSMELYKVLLIESIIVLILSIVLNKYDENKSTSILLLLIPVCIYFIIYSSFNLGLKLDFIEALLIASIITYIVYVILKKKHAASTSIFEVFYIIFLVASTYMMMSYKHFEISILINTVLWIYYFAMCTLIEKKNLKHFFFIGTFISLVITLVYLNLSAYYIIIGIASLLFITYELYKKKKNIYLIAGSILILFTVFFDLEKYSIYAITASILLFVYSYYNIKKTNKFTLYRMLYTFIGFLFINVLLVYFIRPVMIINILTFIIYTFILITMYLSESEKDGVIAIYSILLLFPYYNIVSDVPAFNNIKIELFVLPYILYSLALGELIKFKKNSNREIFVFTLILILSMLTISPYIESIIFSIVLSAIYLTYGINKNMNVITYFGTIYLALSLFIGLFNIFNNIVVVILLLLIGIGLLIYALVKGIKKK